MKVAGREIAVEKSRRRDSKDLVISEVFRGKKFLSFIDESSAREIARISEDKVMGRRRDKSSWDFQESRRSVVVEIVRNRSGRSLLIRSVTKDSKRWRRRVYVPEGKEGEGWISFCRAIRAQLNQELELEGTCTEDVMLIDGVKITPGWKRIKSNRMCANKFGDWEFTVVCRVEKGPADWDSLGRRLQKAMRLEVFELFPFSSTQALILANSQEELDFICRHDVFFAEEDGVSLLPWIPATNSVPHLSDEGGWVGVKGLPFHLWKNEMFEQIATNFGGLDCVGEDTKNRTDFSMARLKVKGDLGIIPCRMIVEDDDIDYTIEFVILECQESQKVSYFRFDELIEEDDDVASLFPYICMRFMMISDKSTFALKINTLFMY